MILEYVVEINILKNFNIYILLQLDFVFRDIRKIAVLYPVVRP